MSRRDAAPRTFDPVAALKALRARPARGRDVRKMAKPYTCREVVFVCSNGWRIEKLPQADWPLESYFMGHCLGDTNNSVRDEGQVFSLRRPDGTPHATIVRGWDQPGVYGRCNKPAKDEYLALVREWWPAGRRGGFHKEGPDDDEQYHQLGVLDDRDYRDLSAGVFWRDTEWRTKRGRGEQTT